MKKVTERQVRDAERLAALYNYVFSVDDVLVAPDDSRSPLVIGEGNTYDPFYRKPEKKGSAQNGNARPNRNAP